MENSGKKSKEYKRRLSIASMNILLQNGFFGLILMHLSPFLNNKIETVATDGERIYFNPAFLDRLSYDDLQFVLLHEIMHIVLKHIYRTGDRNKPDFDKACDIVVNSNILQASGMDLSSITLSEYGVADHTAPDGVEGYKYTAEEIYEMLQVQAAKQTGKSSGQSSGSGSGDGSGDGDAADGAGGSGDGSGDGDAADGAGGSGDGSGDGDAADGAGGSGGGSGNGDAADGAGGSGDGSGDGDAADGAGGSGDGSGDGNAADEAGGSGDGAGDSANGGIGSGGGFCDDHSQWGKFSDKVLEAIWDNRIREAYEAAKSRGTVPMGVERALRDLIDPKVDWRTLLNDFIQEEVTDYSFMPPDRRFSDSPFFLPDFNDTESTVKDILFMVDTSGSMSEEEITQAYSEIKGAIDQFNGRLEGWLGFFDAAVVPPEPFSDEDEFEVICPEGGGGTDFGVIFDYIRDEMTDREIASIIIMTDGYAPFPDESASMDIPVLWMINNENVDPPWGKTVIF